MALAGASALNTAILGLAPSVNQHAALVAFVNEIGDYMDQVQAAGGGPGIFALNRPTMVGLLEAQAPVANSSWVIPFAAAWAAGCLAATLTPGTVSNPAWTTSGVDISVVLTNVPACQAILAAGLLDVKPDDSAAMPMAKAVHDATKAFIFLCTGLGPFGAPIPLPLPAS